MKKKKGISLIVLVITIIVMIVLAGAIILTLNNSGIINKASEAVESTNEATIKEVANMAWAEAYTNGTRDKAGLETAVMTALDNLKVDLTSYKVKVSTSGVTIAKKDLSLNPSGIIPEGAVYYDNVAQCEVCGYHMIEGKPACYCNQKGLSPTGERSYTELVAGQAFPKTIETGDTYIYNGLIYRYNMSRGDAQDYWSTDTELNGWGVGKNEELENVNILESINGKDIVTIRGLYYYGSTVDCSTIKIPDAITNLDYVFSGCEITNIDKLVIPDNVVSMVGTFSGCSIGNVGGLKIPEGVQNISGMFGRANSINVDGLVIPSSVIDVTGLFAGIKMIQGGTIIVNANPTKYENCFGFDYFADETDTIMIKGSCSQETKTNLANTSVVGGIKY